MEAEYAEDSPGSDTVRLRRRGRKSTSCSECHSRKQKCDQETPCARCIRRGVPHLCHPSGEPGPPVKRARLGGTGRGHAYQHIVGESHLNETREDGERVTHWSTTKTPPSPKLGQLYNARGAPAFFGSSYFGHQVAARMIEASTPDLPTASILSGRDSFQSFRDDSGPFSQIWDLLGLLPRNKLTVDRLTEKFLTEVNWSIDALHPETFRNQYVEFWGRRFVFDDLASIDLRWLALLFIVLAFSVLLDSPTPITVEKQKECEEASLRFYWAARRAIVIAPSFYGESTDIVRAGLLVTRYLLYTRRLSESWLTVSFAMRMAQAQGMHVDGEKWGLPRKTTEIRRRLWSSLYVLDKTIALALGRPYAISDQMCLTKEAENVWLDDKTSEEAVLEVAQSLDNPTPSVVTGLGHRLARIIGEIQERCFGLSPASYDVVLGLDQKLVEWADQLPGYFALDNPDMSLDKSHPFLKWHRLHLHTAFHFARTILHRPYLLKVSITDRFRPSHEACISSASADLKLRLLSLNYSVAENLRWTLGAHNLFNSALILGIIAVRRPHSPQTGAILEDLEAYCEKLNRDVWLNEFGLAEVKVVELCIARAKRSENASEPYNRYARSNPTNLSVDTTSNEYEDLEAVVPSLALKEPMLTDSSTPGGSAGLTPDMMWPAIWEDHQFSFPEAADLDTWEQMISGIANQA